LGCEAQAAMEAVARMAIADVAIRRGSELIETISW
jgi:hypothetical protein